MWSATKDWHMDAGILADRVQSLAFEIVLRCRLPLLMLVIDVEPYETV